VSHTSRSVSEALQLGGSFETFYKATRPRIFRAVALVLGDTDVALDAVISTDDWPPFRGTGHGLLALNWARTHLRRLTRERGSLVFEPGYEQRLPDPELIDAVLILPAGCRAVIVARFFLDWSVEETALVLQTPEGTVKTRTHRALKRLREVIEE